ncbi:MAG: helix-turn-helix domain-containing protein [Odoribacter sp.]|nr:helix-turn-helix domain-containing protein [Odoribacter sp.]
MQGLEEEWIEADDRNNVTYASLLPGKYVFHVQGSNNDGIWNEEGARLEIIITPPFWMTWWFQLLLVGFLAGIIIFLVCAYLNRERIKNNLMLEKTRAKQLHEVDMMKLRFFTNISHEIRTPLTLIAGPLEKLYSTSTDPAIKKQLKMVRKNAWKLKDMVEQLLDFRKLKTGKYKVDYQNDDIVNYFKSLTDSFSSLAEERNIKLTFQSNQESYIGTLDSQKTDKIFNNLISNALKYTPAGGQVNLMLEIKEKEYIVTVKDTGVGIPPENLDKIFNRFFQYASDKNITGFGIGLSITHDLIEVLGGKITVDSEKDKGSTFFVTLPLIDKPEEEKNTDLPQESVIVDKEPGNKKYMLVVEDSEDIREFIRTHFESEYYITEATNGKEGLAKAMEDIPDIILTDMLIPVMNGLEMCKKLKKDERTSHIPLLMLTAVTSREVELESLLAGADDYITKPFDIYILHAKVENLLSIRDSFREKIKHDLLLRPSEIVVDSPDERFLKKAVKVVEDYMDDPELDIEKFSEEMGVSRMQLYRKFEALTNMTVKEFIRSIRLKRAAQLLTQEKLTVSEIAWAVGFKDLSYFRKCFKEEFGLTPTDYIKKNTE